MAFFASIWSSPCLASEQELYFHLHQAYEYFEALKKGDCASASRQIKSHLEQADAELGKSISGKPPKSSSPFEPELRLLWKFYNSSDRVALAQIEELRSSVQLKADLLKLNHKKEWHDEIRFCRVFDEIPALK